MNEKFTDIQVESIYKEIDRLMICQGRNIMPMEHKLIWMLDFVGKDYRGIIAGFDYVRTVPGVWASTASVLEGYRQWRNANREKIAMEGELKLIDNSKKILGIENGN